MIQEAPAAGPNEKPLIGVLSAFRVEVSWLIRNLGNSRKTVLAGRTAWEGTMGNFRVLVLPGGMGPDKAAAGARSLARRGVSALLCVGAAGALDPSLRVGDIIAADRVLAAEGDRPPIPCDPAWLRRVRASAERSRRKVASGGLVSVSAPARTPVAKARLAETTGALAVDMESAPAAEAAGVPFLALRAVTDDARTALPDFKSGWKRPVRFLIEGFGFLVRSAQMRRALQALQRATVCVLSETPSPSDHPDR